MSESLWTVELHSHTHYSKDCLTRLDDLQKVSQSAGLDKLAITDHNTATAALEMSRLYPMWIIPGEEIMTTGGELLAWYITEEVPHGLSPKETIQILREQGAVIGVAHPFDRFRKGAWKTEELMQIVEEVDAIEVFNARCVNSEDNSRALAFAQEHMKLMTCGSDAHFPVEYGAAVMRVRPFANNANGLRQALAEGIRRQSLSSPLVHLASSYAKWAKRLFPSLSPTC